VVVTADHGQVQVGADASGWRIDHVSKRDPMPGATRIPELPARRRTLLSASDKRILVYGL